MDPEKLGVVVPPKDDNAGAGNLPKEGEGSPEKKPEEGQGQKPIEGEGAPTPKDGEGSGKPKDQTPSPEIKRLNDLMSKWQSEQGAHQRTQKELGAAKELIEILKGKVGGENKPQEDVPSFMKSDWKPETFDDLRKAIIEAKDYGKKELLGEFESREGAKQRAEEEVDSFMNFLKKEDSEFDEDLFYEYIEEHKFPIKDIQDLGPIYSSFVRMRDAIKTAGQKAKENIDNRADDKVHKPGAGGNVSGIMTGKEIVGARSVYDAAREVLRRIKGE